jgi:uncharacterized tellurite resistance protein B-like protein
MVLGRLFNRPGEAAQPIDVSAVRGHSEADTAALRRIVSQLQELPQDQRKFVAGFAYTLGRVANADLSVSPEEIALMERTVMEVAGLPEPQAVLVVQIGLNHTILYGGTDDYVITREFAQNASREQLEQLLRCAFTIGAADESINANESAELNELGRELGFTDEEVRRFRAEFRDKFSAVQEVRRAGEAEPGSR